MADSQRCDADKMPHPGSTVAAGEKRRRPNDVKRPHGVETKVRAGEGRKGVKEPIVPGPNISDQLRTKTNPHGFTNWQKEMMAALFLSTTTSSINWNMVAKNGGFASVRRAKDVLGKGTEFNREVTVLQRGIANGCVDVENLHMNNPAYPVSGAAQGRSSVADTADKAPGRATTRELLLAAQKAQETAHNAHPDEMRARGVAAAQGQVGTPEDRGKVARRKTLKPAPKSILGKRARPAEGAYDLSSANKRTEALLAANSDPKESSGRVATAQASKAARNRTVHDAATTATSPRTRGSTGGKTSMSTNSGRPARISGSQTGREPPKQKERRHKAFKLSARAGNRPALRHSAPS